VRTCIRCTHAVLTFRIRTSERNLVYACDGPKGPGLSEKISRCSGYFEKKGPKGPEKVGRFSK
jgi:hypothetical protein